MDQMLGQNGPTLSRRIMPASSPTMTILPTRQKMERKDRGKEGKVPSRMNKTEGWKKGKEGKGERKRER